MINLDQTFGYASPLFLLKNTANEAVGKIINQDDEPMKLDLMTDRCIKDNDLKPVTNSIYFNRGLEPTEDGLFSYEIFGQTAKERMYRHAYIDLKRPFLHPYVFERLKSCFEYIAKIVAGEGSWIVKDDGTVMRIKDINDRRYNEDNTGLDWLYKNWKKIKFEEKDNMTRRETIRFLKLYPENEIWITKWIVVPVFYRDYDKGSSSSKPSVPVLNDLYRKLIQYCTSIDDSGLDFYAKKTLYKIESILVEIRKHGQSIIEGKMGALAQTVLGKSTDRGARSVISVPSLNYCDKPEDCLVNVLNSGIPLAKCCETGYPFMIKWILEFFESEFKNKKEIPVYKKDKKTGETIIEYVKIKNHVDIFTNEFIDKKMKQFIKDYGGRFKPIKLQCEDGSEINMTFTGRGFSKKIDDPGAASIAGRPMTWTDIFYMAAVETLQDIKHVYTTRYPLLDYFGTFPSRVSVLSTIKTSPVIINGKVYMHYPVIDCNMSPSEVTAQFIDTVSISNLYLDAIGGDYDGDTVSIKVPFSEEANSEAEDYIHSLKHYVSIQGELNRILGNESCLTFYNMTRYED